MVPSVRVGTKHTNMNDKKDTGEKKIKEVFKETHQHVDVMFMDGSVEQFVDIKGYSLNGPYLVVQMKDDTQNVFNTVNMKRLKIHSTKE